MATKTEIKNILKETNLLESDMEAYWNALLDINSIIRSLHKAGKTWKDLNPSCIRQLPTQKERSIRAAEEKALKEKEEAELLAKQQAEKEYYENNFESIMMSKIANSEKLTEKELSRLVYEHDIQTIEGDDNRWTKNIETIVQLQDKCFSISWHRGLTKYQDDSFCEQPIEVVKYTYEKTITVTEWRKLKCPS